ncbi:hypothetical protein RR46_03472 [Papilio xuthus]|uniref:Uncharacterized protein n=1 Tax=Papilio xuthus TaxID=66420 RepID=A0A194Q9K6_PAPXU|nr:hypothetical protein RR46_03472 [Papilio xuthus]
MYEYVYVPGHTNRNITVLFSVFVGVGARCVQAALWPARRSDLRFLYD